MRFVIKFKLSDGSWETIGKDIEGTGPDPAADAIAKADDRVGNYCARHAEEPDSSPAFYRRGHDGLIERIDVP